MTLSEFRNLYAYNDWANNRLCEMLYKAFGEETSLLSQSDSRVATLQEAAVHIIGSQAMWRSRIQGVSPTSWPLVAEEYPTPFDVRTAFGAERARFWSFLDTLTEESDLRRVVEFRNTAGEPFSRAVWQILQHVLTHSMYHRGQITARLLDMGHEEAVISTDLITYYHANPHLSS